MSFEILQWKTVAEAEAAIAADVNPSARNNYAIKWAAGYGHLGVVEFLLRDPRVLIHMLQSENSWGIRHALFQEWNQPPSKWSTETCRRWFLVHGTFHALKRHTQNKPSRYLRELRRVFSQFEQELFQSFPRPEIPNVLDAWVIRYL